MFEINNLFHEESIGCQKSGKNLGARYDEIAELQKICDYCRENKEKLECEIDKLYDVIVEPGITFCDWVYSDVGEAEHDVKSVMLYMLQDFVDYEKEKDGKIDISLGANGECVCDEEGYKEKRREFLTKMHKVQDFEIL